MFLQDNLNGKLVKILYTSYTSDQELEGTVSKVLPISDSVFFVQLDDDTLLNCRYIVTIQIIDEK